MGTEERTYQVSFVPDRDAAGTVNGFYSLSFDITGRKEVERALTISEARFRGVIDNMPALVSYLDRDERFTFANEAFRDWFDIEPSSMLGKKLRDVVGDEVYAQRSALLARALAGERIEFDSHRLVDGLPRDVHTIYVPDIDSSGATLGVFGLSLNITELKSIERRLAELARVDTLTHLPNRLAFNEGLPLALARARRSGDGLALMFLDIDRFKAINDTFGHAAGDEVLFEFARRLLGSVRTTDTVARLAGDEFVVVLEHLADRETAAAVAEKIVSQVSRPPFQVRARPFAVTTSIGIAFLAPGDPPTSGEELLARADAALYAAKAAGRNTYRFALGGS